MQNLVPFLRAKHPIRSKQMRKSIQNIVAFFAILTVFSLGIYADEYTFSERFYGGKTLAEYAGISDIPEINGYGAYVFSPESGSVIFTKNANDLVYPASTVKLMTALVAYENIPDLSTVITASKSAINATKGSNMAIKVGESFTAEQLLYGVLVTGANDAANVLAEYVGGSIEGFCGMMNDRAKELGANSTYYKNPTGLHHDDMVTSTRDTAVIATAVYYTGTLFEMSATTRYIIDETEQTPQKRYLLNRNLLVSRVRSDKYYYSAAKGMSLGNTPQAGECIVTTASSDEGLTYLCVVMNAPSDSENNFACVDAKNLLKMCLDKFAYADVLSHKSLFCEIPVRLAVDTDYVTLLPGSDVKALLPKDFDYASDITVEPRVSEDYATAPIHEGDVFGEAVVKYKGETLLGAVSLVASRDIDKSNVLYLLDRAERLVLGKWFRVFAVTALVLFALYFALSVMIRGRRRKRGRR